MTIEERIVQLGLNNNNFERHAQESMRTLDKLDKTLNSFGNAVGFDKLGSMIDTVSHRFSALGIAGDQVIRTITNQVTHLVGEIGQLAKSMSFDQVEAGFSKYGEKTQAVQTIMAATAKDWEDQGAQMEWVSGQLEKLNWFTDETSYSFLDMVNNIGKFTSNGIKLEDSVTAMEGISTWAAISGANVTEAGRAMYNLSQAMAVGSVKLMDWKSIENANMSTREFKETALETAVELGTLTKSADGLYKTLKGHEFTTEQFNTYLSDEWFSKDVLTKVLKSYGNFTDILNEASEATGRTASELIREIETYKETGKVASDLVPYIKELASAENDLGFRAFKAAQEAKTFKDAIDATKDAVSTGWMNLWEKMFGNYMEAKGFWTDVAESLYNIFAEPVNKLNEIFDIAFGGKTASNNTAKRVQVLEKYLKEADKTTDDLKLAFEKIDKTRLETLISEYGSLEEAIARGAIEAEELKKILAELGVNPEAAEEIEELPAVASTFEERLAKAGRSMDDFNNAMLKVADRTTLDMIEDYGGVEEALKKGVISAELFKAALAEMAGESAEGTEAVGADISKLSGQLDEYRKVALEVLRGGENGGIWGSGSARKEALEAAGYNYEMIQWMAGNLQAYGYDISDDFLLSLDKTDAVREAFEQLMINAGYTTEEIAAMNELLENSDAILTDIQNGTTAIDRSTEKLDLENGALLFRESIMNILHGVESVADAISQAIDLVFGGSEDGEEAVRSFGAKLNDLIVRFNKFTKTLVLNEDRIESLRDKIAKVLTVIKAINGVIGKVAKLAFGLAKSVLGAVVDVISKVVSSVEELFSLLKEKSFFKNIVSGFTNLYEAIKGPGAIVLEFFRSLFKAQTSKIKGSWIENVANWLTKMSARFAVATSRLKAFLTSAETAEKVRDFLMDFARVVSNVRQTLANAINTIKNAASSIAGFIGNLFKFEEGETIFSRIAGAIQTAIGWITSGFGKLKTAIQNAFGSDGGVGLTEVLSALLKAFLGFTAIKSGGKLLSGLGGLFGGIGSIGEFLKNPASIFSNFADGLKEMFGITKQEGSFTKDLRNIAISIGILALSLKLLAGIDPDAIAEAMGHLTTLLVEMIGALKTIDFIKPGKSVTRASAALLLIAGALLAVSVAMWVLSKIDPERLTGAWEAMSLSLLTMVAVLSLISKIKINAGKLLAAGAAIMGLALAMVVLAVAFAIMSFISGENLAKAWEAMSLSLLSMVAALYLLGNVGAGKMLAAGAAMIMIAGAMLILSIALAALSWVINNNDRIMMAFIITMVVMAGALALLAGIGPMILAAGAALLLAGAGFALGAIGLILLAVGLKAMQEVHIKPDFLLSLGGALIGLGIAGLIFGIGGLGLLIGGAGLLVLATALRVFNGVNVAPDYLLSFGGALMVLGVAGLIFGLGGIGLILGGAGLLVLAVALKTMNGVSVAPDYLLALGGSLIALGIGGLILGLGALGLIFGAAGLAALSAVLPSLAAGVREFTDIGGDALKATFIALAEAIGALFLLQFATILDGTPVLRSLAEAMPSIAAGFKSFEDVNGEAIALAGEGLGKAIGALFKLQFASFRDGVPVLKELSEAMPGVAEGFTAFNMLNPEAIVNTGNALKNAISSLFKLQFSTIRDGTPQLAALADALPKIASGFNAFTGVDPEWLKSLSKALDSALSTLTSGGLFQKKHEYTGLIDLGNALQTFWNGLSGFVGAGDIASPIASINTLMSNINAEVTNALPGFNVSGADIMAHLAEGINSNSSSPVSGVVSMMHAVNSTISAYDSTWVILGGNIAIGVANGIYEQSPTVMTAVGELATAIQETLQEALDIHSPSRVMAKIGGYIGQGLGEGILSQTDYIENSMIVAISPAMLALDAIASDDFSISPTITPVVDMSNINAASGMLGNAFGGQYGVSAQLSNSINSRLSDVERLAASMGNQQTINNGDVFNFNIYAAEGQDEEAIADAVMNRMQARMVRRGAAFGA